MQRESLVIVDDARGSAFTVYMVRPNGLNPVTSSFTPREIAVPNPSLATFEPLSPVNLTWKNPAQDRDSFSQIRHSGRIKMSRYSVGKVSTRFPVVTVKGPETTATAKWEISVPGWGGATSSENTIWSIDYKPGYPPYRRYNVPLGPNHLKYRIDTKKWYGDFSSLPIYDLRTPIDYSSKIEAVKSSVSTNLHKRWDALTDALEGRETLTMISELISSARKPLQTFKSVRERLRTLKGADRQIRQAWLQVRYGILPLMYSVEDAIRLFQESKHKYLTERAREFVHVNTTQLPPLVECVWIEHSGTVSITATAKGEFESRSSRFQNGISLNILNSLWEKIPYSFVVDWFINVGDYLYNQSSALVPPTFRSAMCYAVKKSITTHTYARVRDPFGGFTDYLIKIEEESTYERYPFNQSDIELTLNPNLNWKRWLDAYALGMGALLKALRRLK